MSKYKYEFDENVELSIYHPTSQSLCLKFSNFSNIESFIIRLFKKKNRRASPLAHTYASWARIFNPC